MQGQFGYFVQIEGAQLPGWGGGIPAPKPPDSGIPTPPIVLPPLPPGFKPPDISWKPGSGHPSNPIFIPNPPSIDNTLPGSGGSIDNTLPVPPGTIWPPLNPGDGVQGPGLLLVLVLGADGVAKWKWVKVDAPGISIPTPAPK